MGSLGPIDPPAGFAEIALASAARFRSINHRANRALLLSSTHVSSNCAIPSARWRQNSVEIIQTPAEWTSTTPRETPNSLPA
jgi:hypothetical protein